MFSSDRQIFRIHSFIYSFKKLLLCILSEPGTEVPAYKLLMSIFIFASPAISGTSDR